MTCITALLDAARQLASVSLSMDQLLIGVTDFEILFLSLGPLKGHSRCLPFKALPG